MKVAKIDRMLREWEKEKFPDGNIPPWSVVKVMWAEHLAATQPKSWIWSQLCGPATGPCHCNCMCPAGIAWNAILERGS